MPRCGPAAGGIPALPSGLSDHRAEGGGTAPVSRCRSRGRSAAAVRGLCQPEAWADSGSENPSSEGQKLPARTVFEPPGSIVLIGGAGAGKSSLLRTAVATKVREWQSGEQISWVPVRVQAADLVAARPLPEAIAGGVCDDLSALGLSSPGLRRCSRSHRFRSAEWLVLVDGLDELISAGHRQAVLTKLAGMHAQDEHLFRFVVATRPLTERRIRDPARVGAAEFRAAAIHYRPVFRDRDELVRVAQAAGPADAVERFVAQVQERELVEVARNPLMATILCQLFAENPDASLPPGRGRIFDAFEKLLNSRQYGSSAGGIRNQLIAALAPFGRIAEDAGEKLLERAPGLIRRLAWHRMNGDTAATIDLIDELASRPEAGPRSGHGLARCTP